MGNLVAIRWRSDGEQGGDQVAIHQDPNPDPNPNPNPNRNPYPSPSPNLTLTTSNSKYKPVINGKMGRVVFRCSIE